MNEVSTKTLAGTKEAGLMHRLANLHTKLTFDLNTITSGLRVLGAVVLISALSIFIFKDWHQGDDVMRYIALLGFTLMLVMTGLVSGSWLHDAKGARLFLALGLLAVPINWLIQGALIYSQWQFDTLTAVSSGSLLWQAGDVYLSLVVSLGAWAVLAFVTWLGYKVLAPRSASALTLGFLINGALLLLPIRHSMAVFALAMLMSCVVWQVLVRGIATDKTLSNGEGKFARVIQMLPLVLLLGRSLVVYGFDLWMHTVIAFAVYAGLRELDFQISAQSPWRRRFALLPICAAGISAFFCGELMASWSMPHVLVLPMVSLIFAGLMWELSRHAHGSERIYRGWGDSILAMGMMLNLMAHEDLLSAVLCLVAGMVVLMAGVQQKRTGIAILGIGATLYGIGFHIDHVLDKLDLGGWGSLGAIGILLILGGSMLERFGVQWFARFRRAPAGHSDQQMTTH